MGAAEVPKEVHRRSTEAKPEDLSHTQAHGAEEAMRHQVFSPISKADANAERLLSNNPALADSTAQVIARLDNVMKTMNGHIGPDGSTWMERLAKNNPDAHAGLGEQLGDLMKTCTLLGKNFDLDENMSKNPATVIAFLKGLNKDIG